MSRKLDGLRTWDSIGQELGISRESARSIYRRAMDKIQATMESDPCRYEALHGYLDWLDSEV